MPHFIGCSFDFADFFKMPYSSKRDLVAILASFGLPTAVDHLSSAQWMEVLDALFPMLTAQLAADLLLFAPAGVPEDVLEILKMST